MGLPLQWGQGLPLDCPTKYRGLEGGCRVRAGGLLTSLRKPVPPECTSLKEEVRGWQKAAALPGHRHKVGGKKPQSAARCKAA